MIKYLLIAVFACLLSLQQGRAQQYLGFTGDLGNKVKFSPGNFLKSPMAPSGSIKFMSMHSIVKDAVYIQYGATLGIMGTWLKVSEAADTLNKNSSMYDPYYNYVAMFVNSNVDIGKKFVIGHFPIYVFVGGGATRYFQNEVLSSATTGNEMYTTTGSGNTSEKVFDYNLNLTKNKIKAFGELSIQTEIFRRIMIGIRYQYHFNPALTGTYNFYHSKNASNDTLSVPQRGISLVVMARLGRR